MSTSSKKSVIIVGAGPVGLLIALRLGQEGIDTLVLEKNETPHKTSRALVYNPIVLGLLQSFGILDTVLQRGLLSNKGATWRDINDNVLGHLDIKDDDPNKFRGVLLMGQARMNEIYLEELKKYPSVEVKFGAGCTGVEQSPSSDTVKVMTWQRGNELQDIIYEASYVVAGDGTRSSVRRSLCVPYEGYSWPDWKLVSVHVQYNFAAERGWGHINCLVHPVDWSVIINTGQNVEGRGCDPEEAIWRCSYGEDPSLPSSEEAIMERAVKRVAKYTKEGSPFKVVSAEPYYLHQRCAAQARKGRVVFAGDALHCNNPAGGLGLTTGIVDAYCYGNALVRVIKDGEPDTLLTECANSRLDAWKNVTNPTSVSIFKRDCDYQDEETVKFRTGFFHQMNNNPNFSREMGTKLNSLLVNGFERPHKETDAKEMDAKEMDTKHDSLSADGSETPQTEMGTKEISTKLDSLLVDGFETPHKEMDTKEMDTKEMDANEMDANEMDAKEIGTKLDSLSTDGSEIPQTEMGTKEISTKLDSVLADGFETAQKEMGTKLDSLLVNVLERPQEETGTKLDSLLADGFETAQKEMGTKLDSLLADGFETPHKEVSPI